MDPDNPPAASSLPHTFRFLPTSVRSASPFFNASPDDDDPSHCPAPFVNPARAKTRLEVLKSWEINFTLLSLYAASFIALVYVVITINRTAYTWHFEREVPSLTAPERFIRFLLECAFIALPLYFVLNLLICEVVTDEQIWTCALLVVGLLSTNPLTRNFPASIKPARLIMTDAIYTATIYLYLLLAVHSYRVLDNRRIHSASFYSSKLAIALTYFIVKLTAGFNAGVSLGLIPFSRVLTWFYLAMSGRSTARITIPVLLTAFMDVAFGFWLVKQVAETAAFLASVPYLENRAKQLGFRCFVYQTMAFCLSIISLSVVITTFLPRSYIYFLYDHPHRIFLLEPPIARLGLAFVYFTWTLVLAYVNLPARAFLPFLQHLLPRARLLLRNNRIAVWLGLADIPQTQDPEDVSSEDGRSEAVAHLSQAPPKLGESNTLPLRYRHREIYEVSPLVRATSPLAFRASSEEHVAVALDQLPEPLLPERPRFHRFSSEPAPFSRPIDIALSRQPDPESPPPPRRRLRMRKNMFVMETQVMLVNAAYLAYVPGNPREELPRISNTEISQVGERSPNAPVYPISSVPADLFEMSDAPNPTMSPRRVRVQRQDDGTMFRIDPYDIAKRHECRVYRYFCDENLNTHVLILVTPSRVIVSFSGTRDMTNWGVNAKILRAVLDEKLSRFEYLFDDEETQDDGEDGANIEANRCPPQNRGTNEEEYSAPRGSSSTDRPRERRSLRTRFYGGEADSRFGLLYESKRNAIAFRRSQSEDRISSTRRQPGASATDPLLRGSGFSEYGTVDGEDVPFRPDRQAVAWDDLMMMRHRGAVQMVATAMAREMMTFGQPKVHEGFLTGYLSLRKKVMGALMELYGGESATHRKQNNPDWGIARGMPLFFTGHSLGGAMATFGAYEAARYYKRIGISRRQDVSCTTFGCPRVGNEAFKYRYERLVETHWRFEFASDPIPKVSTLILNYVPVGVQVLIDQSGMLLVDPSLVEVQWWGRLASPYLGYKLHIRASYYMGLRTYCRHYRDGEDDLDAKFWEFPIRAQTRGLFGQPH